MTKTLFRLVPAGLVFLLGCAENTGSSGAHNGGVAGSSPGGKGGASGAGGTSSSGGAPGQGGVVGSGGGAGNGSGGVAAVGGSAGNSGTGGSLATGGNAGSGGVTSSGGGSGNPDAGDARGSADAGDGRGTAGDAGGVGTPDATPTSGDGSASSCKSATPAQSPSGVTPFRAIDGFVTRDGSSLSLCGQPFQVLGTNVYYLQSYSVYEKGNLRTVADGLDDAVRMSLPVVRTWAFNGAAGGDTAVIETAAGKYSETGLLGLDTTIAEAKKRGIRLILTLTNYWKDFGGLPQYATWAGASSADDFYTNTTMQGYFKAYATMLSNRVNTVTGIAYKDEPAILAWEIANELRCPSCADATAMLSTIDSLSKFLKSIFPNQLIADGGEGMDDTPSNWGTFSNSYPVSGYERSSFTGIVKLGSLDMVSYHYYPVDWGMAETPTATVNSDAQAWIDGHATLAKAAGKVAYWGEFGFKRGASDATRAPLYDTWLSTFFGATDNGALAMFWQLVPQSRGADDGFACILGRDTATVPVFEKYSQPRAPR
jgi:mannan endo-1,4-beta-mannosidase